MIAALIGRIGAQGLMLGAVLLALAGSHAWAYRAGVGREHDRNAAALLQVERRAAADLAARTAQVQALETQRRDIATQLETAHADADAAIAAALAENRRLARTAGGLRDPGARAAACPHAVPGPAATTASPADSPTGAELSDRATEFLLELAARADRAAAYAQTCHRWVSALE